MRLAIGQGRHRVYARKFDKINTRAVQVPDEKAALGGTVPFCQSGFGLGVLRLDGREIFGFIILLVHLLECYLLGGESLTSETGRSAENKRRTWWK